MTETLYQLNRTIQLEDGRTLGYAQYGDPSGKPVFFFHGQPGNRLFHPDNITTRLAGVSLIVPDRPGYGLSDYQPGRTLLDWPDDVRQLADALGFEQFDAIGYSAGGPYALACAAKLPQRVGKIMLIASAPPMHLAALRKKMPGLLRFNYFLARRMPVLLRLVFRLYWRHAKRNPAAFIEMAKKDAPPPDLEALSQPALYQMMLECWKENLRVNSRGYVQDAEILFADWGFDLAQVEQEVLLYWGSQDKNTPLQSLRYLEEHLQKSRKILVENAGHFGFLVHWADTLNILEN